MLIKLIIRKYLPKELLYLIVFHFSAYLQVAEAFAIIFLKKVLKASKKGFDSLILPFLFLPVFLKEDHLKMRPFYIINIFLKESIQMGYFIKILKFLQSPFITHLPVKFIILFYYFHQIHSFFLVSSDEDHAQKYFLVIV